MVDFGKFDKLKETSRKMDEPILTLDSMVFRCSFYNKERNIIESVDYIGLSTFPLFF